MLARGKNALPQLWTLVAGGKATEREESAVLLGWIRSADSLGPLRKAYDDATGPSLRAQIAFDVSSILLTEGKEIVDPKVVTPLATAHLTHIVRGIAAGRCAGAASFVVLPTHVPQGFLIPASDDGSVEFHASATEDDFHGATSNAGACGVDFVPFRGIGDMARVGVIVVPPRDEPAPFEWVALYRKDGDRWVPWPDAAPPAGRTRCGSTLCPAADPDLRRPGSSDPVKVLAVETLMEEVRAAAPKTLSEKVFRLESMPGIKFERGDALLFDPYKTSDDILVRAAAEYRSSELTGTTPSDDAMLQALSVPTSEYVKQAALGRLSDSGAVPIDVATELLRSAKSAELRAAAVAAYGGAVLKEMGKGMLPADEAAAKYGSLTGNSRSALLWDVAASLSGKDVREDCFKELRRIAQQGLKVYGEHGRDKERTAVVTQLPGSAREREIVDVLFWGDFASIETRNDQDNQGRDRGGTYLFGQSLGHWYLLGARGWMQ